MATKNYMINDKWLDLDKQNIVELQSVDGVLDSLKVNGSEIETPSGKITITENGSDIDIAQYALADVNVEGGGTSWQTVFEGSVETVDDDGDIVGIIENLTLTGDSIKATLNGTEYILPKTEHGYGAENESGIDFSTYPLFIATAEGVDSCTLWTPTAGTYTLKIEEPQSGGSSDFSTAQVTIVNSSNLPNIHLYFPFIEPEFNDIEAHNTDVLGTHTFTVPLYMNGAAMSFDEMPEGINVTGDAEIDEDMVIITGDCTITIS